MNLVPAAVALPRAPDARARGLHVDTDPAVLADLPTDPEITAYLDRLDYVVQQLHTARCGAQSRGHR
ncbi:hypothetical protein MWU77_24220 [Rhodococcus sp. F64268]|uniref:hypothetical protein n=1 Tax=Rhodococcus sp. F64268 TaxID=2926402 RepID=UPI001FF2A127|nr:hypothetical protein [Rhodococcus sp. F64268]MCK0093877.1 hypothetical protein [Rhodococcus sp. F64268]